MSLVNCDRRMCRSNAVTGLENRKRAAIEAASPSGTVPIFRVFEENGTVPFHFFEAASNLQNAAHELQAQAQRAIAPHIVVNRPSDRAVIFVFACHGDGNRRVGARSEQLDIWRCLSGFPMAAGMAAWMPMLWRRRFIGRRDTRSVLRVAADGGKPLEIVRACIRLRDVRRSMVAAMFASRCHCPMQIMGAASEYAVSQDMQRRHGGDKSVCACPCHGANRFGPRQFSTA